MTLMARYSGTCEKCGEKWRPGDLIHGADCDLPYEQRRNPTVWVHHTCPDPLAAAEQPACPDCFLVHPEGKCDR